MNDWSDGWPALPSRDWDEIYWGDKMGGPPSEDSPDGGLTLVTVSSRVYGMARAEVVEYTTDFLGGDSTSIEQVWYNHNTQRMTVRFTPKATGPGGIYSYDGVSRELFTEFAESESLGNFFRNTFRRPAPEKPWPGVRHDEGRVSFKRVLIERVKPPADLDALKVTRLTTGKGDTFTLHYRYAAEGEMEVRAESTGQAAKLLKEYLTEKGFEVEVVSVTIPL